MTKGTSQVASYAHGAGALPLLGETIGANLERTVARVPESEALVSCHQRVRFTWAELNSAVDRLARALLEFDLEKGDRLGVWSPNRCEWALTQYATAKLGVILVNINPAYRTSELEYALRQSGCRVLVAAPEFKGADYRAMVEEVRDGLPALEQVVFFDSPEWDALAAGDRGPDETELRARMEELDFDDPIRRTVTEHFDLLPEEQREAVRLRVIDEMSYADMAGRLAISEDTARARVSRGLRRLAALLDHPAIAGEVVKQ